MIYRMLSGITTCSLMQKCRRFILVGEKKFLFSEKLIILTAGIGFCVFLCCRRKLQITKDAFFTMFVWLCKSLCRIVCFGFFVHLGFWDAFCHFGEFFSFLQRCWMLSAVAKACRDCGSLWGCQVLWNAEYSEKNYTRNTSSLVPQINGGFVALLCQHSLTSCLCSRGHTPFSHQKSDTENK